VIPTTEKHARTKRLLSLTAVAAAAALGAWSVRDDGAAAAGASRTPAIAVHVGDRIRVLDAPVACRVVRMRQLGGRVAVDCRRGGPLAGTYGTLLTAREASLVRFESKHTARRVVIATHRGSVRQCEARR
jgi:hypothetical protein